MNTVCVFNDLVHIIGKGIILLMKGVHLESAIALASHFIIVPPREFRNKYLFIITLHQVVMNRICQNILTAIGQQHLFLWYTIDLTKTNTDDTLLALVIDTSIEAQRLGIEVADCILHLLTRFEIKFVPIEKIHFLFHKHLLFGCKDTKKLRI